MIERFNTLRKKYGLRMLVVLLSMLFLCTFISRKEGYHMDEILAYQLANAEYNPWILPTEPERRLAGFMAEYIDGESFGETISNVGFIIKDTLTNRGNSILANYKAQVYDAPVWISKEMFQDYLQCDTEDDYNFLSVYYNATDDNHPPLHFMALHLMSSLFKGEISVWLGCLINLVAVAGVLWLLGLIGDIIFKRKSSTVALMLLYGFSMGAVGTAIWVRMYGLLTLWIVWTLYLHLRKYAGRRAGAAGQSGVINEQGDILVGTGTAVGRGDVSVVQSNILTHQDSVTAEKGAADIGRESFVRINNRTGKAKWVGSVGILIVTVMSFWTQYFGLFFILPLAAVTVILLARDRRMQELWAYIRTMVTAAVIGVCVYPFAVSDVLFSERGTQALGQWQNGLSEFADRLAAFGGILGENVAGSGWLLILALLVPGVWLAVGLRSLRKAVDGGENTVQSKKAQASVQSQSCADGKQGILWWQLAMCGVPTLAYFLLAAKMSPYFVDRYIMAIFPVTALLIVWLWDRALARRYQGKEQCSEIQQQSADARLAEETAAAKKRKRAIDWQDLAVVGMALLLVVCQNIHMNGQHPYLYTGYSVQLAVADEYAEYPCVCLYPGFSFYENIMEMERYAQTMLVKSEELASMDEERVAVTEEGYITLIKYPGEEAGKAQLAQVMEMFGGSKATLLYQGGAHGDVIYLVMP